MFHSAVLVVKKLEFPVMVLYSSCLPVEGTVCHKVKHIDDWCWHWVLTIFFFMSYTYTMNISNDYTGLSMKCFRCVYAEFCHTFNLLYVVKLKL